MKITKAYNIFGILIFLLSIAAENINAGGSNGEKSKIAINIRVDPRIELVSIIFRLAGNPEYNRSQYLRYVGEIEQHFGEFKEHDVVKLAKKLRGTRGVSYDAPMSLAIHIKDINEFNLLLPLEPWPDTLDNRWQKESVLEFLIKAKQFAKEAKFDEFYELHKPMYDRVAEKFSSLMETESHLEWFDEFFGAKPGAEFNICLGLTNGPSNYGPHIKLGDKEKYYCIQGVWKFAFLGFGEPQFDKSVLPTVIHEFCHSYANPIVEAHESEIEKSGKRVYALVEEQMKRNAYGNWLTVMRESLVRACVIRYLAKNEGEDAAKAQAQSDINRGFLWIQELSDLLIEYEDHRDKYPNLDAFFPKVKEFFDNYKKD